MLLALPSLAMAQLIDLEKLRSKETQAEIKRKTDSQSVDPKVADEAPANPGTSGGVDFTSDFARAIEKTKPKEAPVSSRFSDEVAKRRADRFFGSSAPAPTKSSGSQTPERKEETFNDFLEAAESEYRKMGDFPQAIENTVRADWRRFGFVRTFLADLRSNYSERDKKNVCEYDYSAMKNNCTSSLIEDNPDKMVLISTAYKKAQKAHDDGLGASLNYGSSTVKQERATPDEIEKRLIGQ